MKFFSRLLLLSLFGWGWVFAQSNLPACQGSDVSRWSNCVGSNTFASGNKYVGEHKNGKPNGQGTYTFANGSIYVGEHKDGRRNGQFSVTFASGDKYVGGYKDDKIDGQGTYTFANGSIYVGEFKDGKRNGQGTFTTAKGDKYVGEYKDDKLDGQGTYTFASGNIYVGEHKDGKPNGHGTYTFANGNKYVGEHKDGKRNGQFTATFADGNKFVGEYKDDKRNGQGTFTFANGNKFVGEYKDEKRNGQGTEYAANGSIINQGICADGNFVRTASVQQATVPNNEIEKLRAEAEESKRLLALAEDQKRIQTQIAETRQRELEEQLKLAKIQNQVVPPTAMTTMANRKALVIGNDTYKSITKLLNAREDAKAIASNLTAVGYKVTLHLDLNEKDMKTALRTFSSQVQGGDEVMFFYAGHGVQLGATNYLLPIDIGGESEAQVKDEAIQLQRGLDDMTEKKTKFTLAMIDACRDNPFKSAGRNIGGRGMAPTTAATGQMVVFSAGTGQQALDRLGNNDKNKNGVFTRTFLKEMQKSGVSIDRIVKNVRNEVAELAKTIGHEQVPAIYDQVLGDFYFKK